MSLAAEPLAAEQFEDRLLAEAPGFGLSLSPVALTGLARFLAELDVWRRRTNLTGPLPPSELVLHTLESALGAALVPPESRVLDIGSGAGFPGVPIALVRTDVQMNLLEPRSKRAEFLRHLIRTVPIEDAEVLRNRLETARFAKPFDCAVLRAVGDLPGLIGPATFLKPGGTLLAWTTTPATVMNDLPGFAPGRAVAVPGSRRKVVAELVRQ
jgi:16S rRNA (guanine527-N7)-methyltransferase